MHKRIRIQNRLLFSFAGCLFVTLVVSSISFGADDAPEILIGSGETNSMNYHVGRALCRVINTGTKEITCKTLATADTFFNLANVRGGSLEMGIVESDLQYRAVKRKGLFQFSDITYENVRALFSVHSIPFTLLARRDSGISQLDDLKGKRVNIGNPGSRQRTIMDSVVAAKGWTKNDFLLTEELPASQSQDSLALCHGRIQALVYTVVHPNLSAEKVIRLCNATIIKVGGPKIVQLVKETPYYAPTAIPKGIYGNAEPIPTFGLRATVVASEDLDEETAYIIVKTLFDRLKRFKRMHPAFNSLTPSQMTTEGLIAPLHKGAVQYYQEKGWM